jgi:hypothetical protein
MQIIEISYLIVVIQRLREKSQEHHILLLLQIRIEQKSRTLTFLVNDNVALLNCYNIFFYGQKTHTGQMFCVKNEYIDNVIKYINIYVNYVHYTVYT